MANVKISDLAALGTTAANTSLVEIETSGGDSKKVTVAELVTENGKVLIFLSSITVGNTGTPSLIVFTLKNPDGTTFVPGAIPLFLHVRLCDATMTNTNSATGTIAPTAATSTSLIESVSAFKDLIVSSTDGVFSLSVTNATTDSMDLFIGPSSLVPITADYYTNGYLNFSH